MEVYLMKLSEVKKLPASYAETHFPKRLSRSENFLREDDRWRSVGAGALLSFVLGADEDAIGETAYHKPFLLNGKRHFNLSHSGDYVLLAVDREEIGADIEKIDPSHLDLAEEVFLTEERRWMEESPLHRFFTLWTLKESVMKKTGLGFELPPASFSVLPLIQEGEMTLNQQQLYAKSTEFDGYAVSVCRSSPIRDLSFRVLSASDIGSPSKP